MKKRFNIWRVAAVTIVCAAVILGVGYKIGLLPKSAVPVSSNSLLVIAPYRHAGTWVFDDPAHGLKKEPFVAGIPELIDKLVADIPDAGKGFRLTFSAHEFPGYSDKLVWRRESSNGNWYYSEKFKTEGWLCPALLKYFQKAPAAIYVKAESK